MSSLYLVTVTIIYNLKRSCSSLLRDTLYTDEPQSSRCRVCLGRGQIIWPLPRSRAVTLARPRPRPRPGPQAAFDDLLRDGRHVIALPGTGQIFGSEVSLDISPPPATLPTDCAFHTGAITTDDCADQGADAASNRTSFERFPHLALAATYSADALVTDSANGSSGRTLDGRTPSSPSPLRPAFWHFASAEGQRSRRSERRL